MPKRFLPFFLLIFEALFCFDKVKAQQGMIDSLIIAIETEKEDTSKINTYLILADRLSKKGDFPGAMNYAKQSLALAESLSFDKGQAKSLNMIGYLYKEQANYSEALKSHLTALKLNEKIGFREGIAKTYTNLGNVYFQKEVYDEALKNYNASLAIAKEIGNKKLEAHTYTNIGTINNRQGKKEEALQYYLQALDLGKEIDDTQGMMYSYTNIGGLYSNLKQYQLAEESIKKGLELAEQLGNKTVITGSYINLGDLYYKLGKKAVAREFYNQGIENSKELGNKYFLRYGYLGMAKLDSSMGNFKDAFQYLNLYSGIKDSILNEESSKQISQLRLQFESDKKDEQIKNQDLQIKTQMLDLQNQTLQNEILKTRIYYGIAFFALVIGIIILLFFLRSRRKQKEFQHMLKDLELTILKSQLNPHFISNALSNIKTFIDNQPDKASQFLTKFARLMRRVLELNEEKLIPLNEELETIELYMQIEAIRLRFGFDYKIEIDDEVNEEMTMVPPLILQPAIENAIWHGLSQKPEKGYIHIKIGIEKEHLKIKIEDNGVGESEDYQNELEDSKAKGRKSFGVNITRKRIEILSDSPEKKGDFELKFLKDCTIAEITLPVFY